MSKQIKIFIASSIVELHEDREAVASFFLRLNKIYKYKNVEFELLSCDDYDASVSVGGKQLQYDREIEESELVIFLFYKKVGDVTRHEFNIAWDSLKTKQSPTIVTYVKCINEQKDVAADVEDFMNSFEHYYSIYTSPDELKFRIIMHILTTHLDAPMPDISEGKIYINGNEIADADNIPMFSGNNNLNKINADLREITARYYQLREEWKNNPDNGAAYEEYCKVASEKESLEEEKKKEEKIMIDTYRDMVKNTEKGNLSERQIEGYRLFEKGDIEGALEILDEGSIYHDIEYASTFADRLQIHIGELLQRIDLLKAKGVDKKSSEKIKEYYKKAYEVSEKYNLDKKFVVDYISFLYEQSDYNNAMDIAEKLSREYDGSDITKDYKTQKELYNAIALLYDKNGRHEDAETFYLKALSVVEAVGSDENEEFGDDISTVYNNLGGLYKKWNKLDESEKAYTKSLEVRKELYEQNSDAHADELASVYNNLGGLHEGFGRYDEAEKMYLKSLELCEELYNKNPDAHADILATIYNNLGGLYRRLERDDEAEKMYLKSLEIRAALYRRNPDANADDIAVLYNNIGGLYRKMERLDEAEKMYNKSFEIRKELYSKNPDANADDFARIYNNIAVLYCDTERYDEAKKMYNEAIEIRKELYKQNPESYADEYAKVYSNLGGQCVETQEFRDAERAYRRALRVREGLYESNPEGNEEDLAEIYKGLLTSLFKQDEAEQAEKYCRKAEPLYESLYKKDPEKYAVDYAVLLKLCMDIYVMTNQPIPAKIMRQRAIEIIEKHKKTLKGNYHGIK